MLFHVFGTLSQYELALIKERVLTGIAAAKNRGQIDGRPLTINAEKLDAIIIEYEEC